MKRILIVDDDRASCELLQEIFAEQDWSAETAQTPARARELAETEQFDLVLSFDVIEHIPDTERHLLEVRRVLKPGGSYLLQTPNKWTNSIFETIRWRSVSKWRVDHCSLHTYRQLRQRLAVVGRRVADCPAERGARC